MCISHDLLYSSLYVELVFLMLSGNLFIFSLLIYSASFIRHYFFFLNFYSIPLRCCFHIIKCYIYYYSFLDCISTWEGNSSILLIFFKIKLGLFCIIWKTWLLNVLEFVLKSEFITYCCITNYTMV